MTLDKTFLIEATKRLVLLSRELEHNPDRTREGGILTVGLNGFSEKYVLEAGIFRPEKKEKYTRLSQEKAHRLYSHWLRQPEIAISSWQTRSPDAKDLMPGGAVLFPNGDNLPNIISFSGLCEHADEAVSTMLGYQLRFTRGGEYAGRIASISGNPMMEEFLRKLAA